jgi:hypothetical protein
MAEWWDGEGLTGSNSNPDSCWKRRAPSWYTHERISKHTHTHGHRRHTHTHTHNLKKKRDERRLFSVSGRMNQRSRDRTALRSPPLYTTR